MLTVSVIFSTMLAISTGVSASEFNELIISLLQTVVEGKFVIGPKGIEEVIGNVVEGNLVIGPNDVEGKFVIGPFDVEGKFVIGPFDVEGKFVIGPVGIEEVAPDVEEGKFVIGPLFEGIEVEVVVEGEGTIACVSGA